MTLLPTALIVLYRPVAATCGARAGVTHAQHALSIERADDF
jgi:hypothetical protein